MDKVWESLHATQEWGKYPSTDVIRHVKRAYRHVEPSGLKVLEVGCGAGANLSFFVREGFESYGLDGSQTAVSKSQEYLASIDSGFNIDNIIQGDFTRLPYGDNEFDVVVDNLALYTCLYSSIRTAFTEVYRVLKAGGRFYSRSWAQGCEGYNTGTMIEPGTSENPQSGPCKEMGVSHFFSERELRELAAPFSTHTLRVLSDRDMEFNTETLEWVLWAEK